MEEINRNIENLIDSVDYLVEFLERTNREKSDETDFSYSELNQNVKGFEKYLKTIQENTSQLKDIKGVLNAHFENIDTLQPKTEEASNVPLNTDIEDKHFAEIQTEIKALVEKIGDLSNTLNQAGIKLDIDVNPANLQQIKEQLEELKLSPQINFDNVLSQLKEVKENFESLQNLDIKNVDFEVLNADKIDSILEKVGEFKNLSIGFKDEDVSNLTKIEESLKSIKDIDFNNLESLKDLDNLKSLKDIQNIELPDMKGLEVLKEIDFDKLSKDISNIDLSGKFKELENLDIDPIIEKINSLNDIKLDNLTLDIDVKDDIFKKVDDINSKISELKDNLSNINISSELNLNVDTTLVKDNIIKDLKDIDVNVKPIVDMSQLDSIEQKEYKINIKTEVDDVDLPNKSLKTSQIQNDISDRDSKLLEQMNLNNEILKTIASNLSNNKAQSVENNTTTNINQSKSITEVKPVDTTVDVNIAILNALSALLDKTGSIYMELLKSRFDSNSSPLL